MNELFGSDSEDESRQTYPEGLYHIKEAVPEEFQRAILQQVAQLDLFDGSKEYNQSMLFDEAAQDIAVPILQHLEPVLKPIISSNVHASIFRSPLRPQLILNLYKPGQGISDHFDLVNRYADGILGLSFLSSAVMHFKHVSTGEAHSVLLRPGDLYILSGSARYDWTHGIDSTTSEIYTDPMTSRSTTIRRQNRFSITIRRLLPDADTLQDPS